MVGLRRQRLVTGRKLAIGVGQSSTLRRAVVVVELGLGAVGCLES